MSCEPYKEGGLGIRNIRATNEGFLFKLTWEIFSKKDSGLTFILERHSKSTGGDVRYHTSSSIWEGLARIRGYSGGYELDSGCKFCC